MTPLERVQSVLQRRFPDRLPVELRLTPLMVDALTTATGASDPDEYFGLDVRNVYFAPPADVADFSPYYPDGVPTLWNPPGWEVGEWGVGVSPGSLYHFVSIQHPMRNLTDKAELVGYPFPDLTRPERHNHLTGDVRRLHERGFFVIGFMEWTIFEIAWHLRGMENLFADIAFDRDFVEYLLEKITETRCFQARKYAEAGVDMLKIGDDLGTQRGLLLSRDMYREWFQPRHARVIAAAREVNPSLHVSYHSDGDCWDIIPDLIEAGVTVLNPIQPECLDLAEVKREFGKDLIFLGGIGTQTTMPFGTPDEVRETVRRTIDTLGPTGYFPCPTHVLEPEVSWENIEAYLEATRAYRV